MTKFFVAINVRIYNNILQLHPIPHQIQHSLWDISQQFVKINNHVYSVTLLVPLMLYHDQQVAVIFVGYEVLTAKRIKIMVFSDELSCSVADGKRKQVPSNTGICHSNHTRPQSSVTQMFLLQCIAVSDKCI
jgi:hypothetical protein